MGVAAHLQLGEEDKALAAGAPHGLNPALLEAWKRGLRTPLTSSLGRFFDAAANLLGLCEVATFEAEAAMLLEALAHSVQKPEGLSLGGLGGEPYSPLGLPPAPSPPLPLCTPLNLHGLLQQLTPYRHAPPALRAWVALGLHEAVALALAQWAEAAARRLGVWQVALGGGCLQNRLLCEALAKQLRQRGFEVLLPRQLPPNDGGLCLGQALAATQHFHS